MNQVVGRLEQTRRPSRALRSLAAGVDEIRRRRRLSSIKAYLGGIAWLAGIVGVVYIVLIAAFGLR